LNLDRKVVEHVARLARLALSEDEIATFSRQLGEVLVYMERLNEVNTEGIAPMTHVVDLENVTRQDVAEPPLASGDALRNAPSSREGMFLVPRVIDTEAAE
jgi:aspartyl-tRNA(Asn)/glutamyl-tRNA(Gln) amidotransferase subunit C